jgi:uncharacterized RDD family membrane protein YckC
MVPGEFASTLDARHRVAENNRTIARHSEEVPSLSEPEEIRFACIGCGTYNPSSAEVCNGCGHQFAGPDVISKVRITWPRRHPENPYAPPIAPIVRDRSLRIGSILAWTAVIAVCLGALRENLGLGLHAIISLLPATFWTSMKAGKRRVERRPMLFVDRLSTFLAAMFCVWGILIASAITFLVCVSGILVMTRSLGLGLILGTVCGVSCAGWLTHALVSADRERDRRSHEIRYR